MTFAYGHFFGKCLFTMFSDIIYTCRAVRSEQESEKLSYEIGVYLTIRNILITLSTGVKAVALGASPDFTP